MSVVVYTNDGLVVRFCNWVCVVVRFLYVLSLYCQWLLIDSQKIGFVVCETCVDVGRRYVVVDGCGLAVVVVVNICVDVCLVKMLMLNKKCFLLCLPLVILMSYRWFQHLLWSVLAANYKYRF